MVEVNDRRGKVKPRFGWRDSVKVVLCSRGMTVGAARQYAKDRKLWRSLVILKCLNVNAAMWAVFSFGQFSGD